MIEYGHAMLYMYLMTDDSMRIVSTSLLSFEQCDNRPAYISSAMEIDDYRVLSSDGNFRMAYLGLSSIVSQCS